ncbi:uncharacterized protein EV420DRAFT_1072231 [Desarmillaria tabescens]|uniref:Uncharacterized protein n=1 Tax=Armillaria tabescens TaxID=1929756 RepID=A0AA39MPZ0_ARMTA|nr:uncharacterized protein EV420DRAFT_1072231 [Desarmillaria tabescens]KAK0442801.1 hypothetical protein EV420DRAFT_1072231 [Desarmillaria tabescens]
MNTSLPNNYRPTVCTGRYPENGCQGNFPLKGTPGLCERCHLLNLSQNSPEEHARISIYFQCNHCGAANREITVSCCCLQCAVQLQVQEHETMTKCVGDLPENSCQGNFPFKKDYGLCNRCDILNSLEDNPNAHVLVSSYPQCRKCGAIAETMPNGVCSSCKNISVSPYKMQCTAGIQQPEHMKHYIAPTINDLARRVIADARDYRSEAWVTRMYGRATQRHGVVQPEM